MLPTKWATVESAQIRLPDSVELREGAQLLVTFLPEEEDQFWLGARQSSLAEIWDNVEDDVYSQLLKA